MSVIGQLLRQDLLRYKREFFSKFFDTASLLFTNLIVFGYFMSQYGLQSRYGPFMLVGAIASFGFFDIVAKISYLMADIEGDRTISYTLTLPIPSWLVFMYIGLYWSMNSALISLFILPMGKLILFKSFSLSGIAWVQFILMYITMSLFYGFFSLWLTSTLKKIGDLGNLWVRIINPLVMFGAYFYAWQSVYVLSPLLAYCNLINPMVYVMEGMRAATLGQEGFLPFWLCLSALWIFIIVFAAFGIHRLQNRLDCVR